MGSSSCPSPDFQDQVQKSYLVLVGPNSAESAGSLGGGPDFFWSGQERAVAASLPDREQQILLERRKLLEQASQTWTVGLLGFMSMVLAFELLNGPWLAYLIR